MYNVKDEPQYRELNTKMREQLMVSLKASEELDRISVEYQKTGVKTDTAKRAELSLERSVARTKAREFESAISDFKDAHRELRKVTVLDAIYTVLDREGLRHLYIEGTDIAKAQMGFPEEVVDEFF